MKKENQGVNKDEKGGKKMNEEKQGFVAARLEGRSIVGLFNEKVKVIIKTREKD